MRHGTRIATATLLAALLTGVTVTAADAAHTASPRPGPSSSSTLPAGAWTEQQASKLAAAPAPGTPDPQVVAALANVMGVSPAQAAGVLQRLDAIAWSAGRRVSTSDPRVQALAGNLHMTAHQLVADLMQMKRDLAAGTPAPSARARA